MVQTLILYLSIVPKRTSSATYSRIFYVILEIITLKETERAAVEILKINNYQHRRILMQF